MLTEILIVHNIIILPEHFGRLLESMTQCSEEKLYKYANAVPVRHGTLLYEYVISI